MNTRNAILKAADHIEANPGLFDFSSVKPPYECGTPGCALGWINVFSEVKPIHQTCLNSHITIGVPSEVFYKQMNFVSGEGNYDWTDNGANCAISLRLYADKYHPGEMRAEEISPEVSSELNRIFNSARVLA